jgi:hypothetical protein
MTAQNILNEETKNTEPTACGTGCGASDETKNTEPTACGTGCGAGE